MTGKYLFTLLVTLASTVFVSLSAGRAGPGRRAGGVPVRARCCPPWPVRGSP
ncbi:MAG: hypothetical protein ACLRNQ_02590 [Flavonifractor plautii]